MKKSIYILVVVLMIMGMTGCTSDTSTGSGSDQWIMLEKSAEETTVNLYHDYKNPDAVVWFEEYLAGKMEAYYGIRLTVTYKTTEELHEILKDDHLNERNIGEIDLIVLEEDGFLEMQEDELLYGPFLDKLPNFETNFRKDDYEANYYYNVPIEGYAAPFGKEQLVFIYNEDVQYEPPKNLEELSAYIRQNKGRFTYPYPTDETGKMFINTVVCNIVGWETVVELNPDREEVKAAIDEALKFFVDLKPYMWKEGEIQPENEKQLDDLFADDKLDFAMSMDHNHATSKIKDDEYPYGTNVFVLEDGTISKTQYMMIPFNSANKSGAMVVMNFMLSGEAQGNKYSPSNWGNLPSVDIGYMPTEEKKLITKNTIKRTSLKEEELMNYRLPPIPDEISDIIMELWNEAMR